MRIILLVAVLVFGQSTFALNLKEKKAYKEWVEELKGPGKVFQDKCGYNIPVTLDQATVTPFMADKRDSAIYCRVALEVLSEMCGADADNKAAITGQVKKLECKFAKDKMSLNLASGTLIFAFNSKSSNLKSEIKNYLENNLQ